MFIMLLEKKTHQQFIKVQTLSKMTLHDAATCTIRPPWLEYRGTWASIIMLTTVTALILLHVCGMYMYANIINMSDKETLITCINHEQE